MANKSIKIPYKGKELILEYTRETVAAMERSGIVLADIKTKPMSTLPRIFEFAFKANHPRMKRADIDDIYKRLDDKERLYDKLSEMLSDTIETLFEVEDEKNAIAWTADF